MAPRQSRTPTKSTGSHRGRPVVAAGASDPLKDESQPTVAGTGVPPKAGPAIASKRLRGPSAFTRPNPARSRHSRAKGVAKVSRTAGTQLIRAFYSSLPPEVWDRVLANQPVETPGGKLLAVMNDPAFARMSIERQCREAGITDMRDLAKLVSDHALSHAIIESARHTTEILEGLASDSKVQWLVCDLCLDLHPEGDPSVPTTIEVAHPRVPDAKLEIECPKCGGVGRVRRSGDPRARETFLKLHGGLEEGPATNINVNTQVNMGGQHASGVHRGRQLLEMGRQSRPVSATPASVIDVVSSAEGRRS